MGLWLTNSWFFAEPEAGLPSVSDKPEDALFDDDGRELLWFDEVIGTYVGDGLYELKLLAERELDGVYVLVSAPNGVLAGADFIMD
ncbi:MAG: hypothetical protein LBF56_02595 [Holosporales bacterium]|nr:hypothetical protein [Holosporales bacterium]